MNSSSERNDIEAGEGNCELYENLDEGSSATEWCQEAQATASSAKDYTSSTLKEVFTIAETGVRFTDVVCLETGTLLAVDDVKNFIWAYDSNGARLRKTKLSSPPWALTVVDTTQVGVTLCQNSLQFLTFNEKSKRFRKDKTILLDEMPRAVIYADNCLYVTFEEKVKKLTFDGIIVTELAVLEASQLLFGISYSNGNVIVADSGFEAPHSVHEITMDTNPLVKQQKKYSVLTYPLGITADPEGNIYVGGYGSNNVIQVSKNGDVLKEILSSSSGYNSPMGINFSSDGLKFFLTHENKITVFEFQ
ncbi:hypothetical protein FSP39_010690 [Pinctada imbricata]|uniref:Uncharacterized protein n=1 Tax=Pinctada imbricata TaxID=66713 RepID=A0AA88Y3A2_PINIB|nr:hypothetical protein FSP39_010690 [Pinctada imbricata]